MMMELHTDGYYWNNSGQSSANRMTPTLSNAILTQMEIYITGVNTGTATYKPIVLSNNGGSPGSDLATLNFKTASSYPGWDPTSLTSYGIYSLNGDFFVGLNMMGPISLLSVMIKLIMEELGILMDQLGHPGRNLFYACNNTNNHIRC